MGVMGYFFIMGRMTLGTLSPLLGVMRELRCLRVTDGTRDNLVGCGEVFPDIYGGNPFLGHFLCPGFPFAMAVKTEPGHLPAAHWIICRHGSMAGHAFPVRSGWRRQGRPFFMAYVALLTRGSVSITSFPQGRIKGKLGMGIVTLYALSVILIFLDPECSVKALFQPLFNIIMAGKTLIGLKKI